MRQEEEEDIILRIYELIKLDYLPFNPVVLSHSRIWKAAFGTFFPSFMKCIMAAPSTSNMCLLPSELTH